MNSNQYHELENLSREELIQDVINSKNETVKYVNKFLELAEKWTFINLFLKELNSIRQKMKLCETISEGFLKLTNSNLCYFCLFNQDNKNVEFQKLVTSDNKPNKDLTDLINAINANCYRFLRQPFNLNVIDDYFQSLSGNEYIAAPIIYNKAFLGYLMIVKNDSNFYNENINFISIFPEHIALILENISLYQESENQNKRKVEFLAGISHEFKTPLNSIIGFAEILKHRLDSKKTMDDKHSEFVNYINNVLQSSKHLLSLIEDIIDVSKSQYRNLELKYSEFNPKEEVINIISALEEMMNEKNISISYTMVDIKLYSDLKRFRQLIYNLISNAIKFNKKHGDITILTYIQDGNFYFEITDSGDGISKRNYGKIFDFFSQVNRSQLKRQLGSGIGLALCKKITDAHKGCIGFSSELKKGSTFWFCLPLRVKIARS